MKHGGNLRPFDGLSGFEDAAAARRAPLLFEQPSAVSAGQSQKELLFPGRLISAEIWFRLNGLIKFCQNRGEVTILTANFCVKPPFGGRAALYKLITMKTTAHTLKTSTPDLKEAQAAVTATQNGTQE